MASVGAAHLEGGAAQATLALTLGPVPWKAGGGALTTWTLLPHRGRERVWSRHHPVHLLGGANTELCLSLNPLVDSVSIPMRISRKSSVSLSPSPLPRCYRNWVILLYNWRGGGWQEEAAHQLQLYRVCHMGSLLSNTPARHGPSGPAVPEAGP